MMMTNDDFTLRWYHGKPLLIEAEDKVIFERLCRPHQDAMMATGRGLTYEKAAEYLGVAVGTVKSRVNRGRKRFLALKGIKPEPEPAPVTMQAVDAYKAAEDVDGKSV